MAAELLTKIYEEAEKLAKLNKLKQAEEEYTKFIVACKDTISKSEYDIMQTNWNEKLALAYNNRGLVRYLQVEFSLAVDDYTTALHHNPHLAVAFYNRGLVHYRLGDFDEAITDLQEALSLDPNFLSAQENLNQALLDRGSKVFT